MASNNITAAQIANILNRCDDAKVSAAYSDLGPINGFSDVLDKTNPANPAVCLAADQIVHMTESWRYLASAMYAYLNNEHGNAIHLAYYCELRAALSLFSGSGLRISMGDGFWLDANGVKQPLPKHRTHQMAWAAWKEWVKRADAQSLLEKRIRIMPNTTLEDFGPKLRQFNAGLVLSGWGFDLINLADDHHSRNRASYNAYWRTKSFVRMGEKNLRFAKEFSELFLSTGSSSLVFDKALIQYLVHSTIQSIVTFDGPHSIAKYEERAEHELAKITEFVSRQTGSDEASLRLNLNANIGKEIFESAKNHGNEPENVLARAGFLARLAMLAVKRNVDGTTNGSARAWMMNWLEHCGQWDPASGSAPHDIEAELSDAIDALPDTEHNLPLNLWTAVNVPYAIKLSNLHSCIAWGVAA